MDVKIVDYEPRHREDMLACYLSAKAVMDERAPQEHRSIKVKEDLLDIEKHYFDEGSLSFWLALDGADRVVGMLGFIRLEDDESIRLRRFFVEPSFKGRGIGGKLLAVAEGRAVQKGITRIYTRFADWYDEADKFYTAKGFIHERRDGQLIIMMKELG